MNPSTKLIQKLKQNCYRKVGRAIEKNPILEKLPFLKGNKFFSHFDGSNNIFVDCINIVIYYQINDEEIGSEWSDKVSAETLSEPVTQLPVTEGLIITTEYSPGTLTPEVSSKL